MGTRLTALDATFLELEEADESAHMHIGGVMVFEPREDGSVPSMAEVASHLERRLGGLPRFRQRLSEPRTGGLRFPDWEDDPRFEIASHVRRASLPAPGGQAELVEWAGEFFSERLDRARPLWEMVVVEGLAGGRWALATKTHHCMVDGVGSVDIGTVILDSEPGPAASPRPATEAGEPPAGPAQAAASLARSTLGLPLRAAALPVRAARAGAGAAARATRSTVGLARRPGDVRELLHRGRAMVEVLVRDELIAAPATSLNRPIGGKRRLALIELELAELKAIKNALGGTVNDVVLAITAGGLRRLLLGRSEQPPAQGIRAMVPMNVRGAGEQLALGNKITSLFVHLPVAIADPLERYRAQVAEAEALKSGSQAEGSAAIIDFAGRAPPVIHTFLARALFATRLFNVTITNVPGPQTTLYAFGSRMEAVWPLVPLAAAHAVGIAVFSYAGRVFLAINADSAGVPDLEVLSEGIAESLAELRQLSEAALSPAARS